MRAWLSVPKSVCSSHGNGKREDGGHHCGLGALLWVGFLSIETSGSLDEADAETVHVWPARLSAEEGVS